MLKPALAVIAGFVLWSVLWVSYNITLRKFGLLPPEDTQPLSSVQSLGALLIGSILLSLLAGYLAAAIGAPASGVSVAVLGVLLLIVGVVFQVQYWRLMPLWYHASFLLLLVPMCLLGAWLRTRGTA
jgi:hypothetical protein